MGRIVGLGRLGAGKALVGSGTPRFVAEVGRDGVGIDRQRWWLLLLLGISIAIPAYLLRRSLGQIANPLRLRPLYAAFLAGTVGERAALVVGARWRLII